MDSEAISLLLASVVYDGLICESIKNHSITAKS